MDEQILKAIKCNCGDLTGITTDEFYNDYLEFCAMDFVKPRQKSVVIREACEICGVETKRKTYKVFCGVKK